MLMKPPVAFSGHLEIYHERHGQNILQDADHDVPWCEQSWHSWMAPNRSS
jgi:hypothetical protein